MLLSVAKTFNFLVVPGLALADSIQLCLGSTLLAFLVNLNLTEMPEAIPSLETGLHKGIGIDQAAGH